MNSVSLRIIPGRSLFIIASALAFVFNPDRKASADEQLWGWVIGAETLPKNKWELYQFLTLREGKNVGSYHVLDAETEVEYGFTDKFQMSLSLSGHYFDVQNVDGQEDQDRGKFGGIEASGKYRFTSPFKDPVGIALKLTMGFLRNDDVGGIHQKELLVLPEIVFQKNFRDDTITLAANLGFQLAWGKRPAEEYDREISLMTGLAASYRFAPNWFIGVESHYVGEWPHFKATAPLNTYEHQVIYAGPALHYGAKRWWATFSYNRQVWGNEIDPVVRRRAYAEEQNNQFRLKVGFNF